MESELGSDLKQWAHVERQFLRDDIGWLKAGAKLFSPSGDDITDDQIERLIARLEHVNAVLAE